MKGCAALFFLLIGVFFAVAQENIVNTQYGPVDGAIYDDARAFLGVPFATPPVGPLRLAPPQPPQSWAPNTVWAKAYQAGCPQLCQLPPLVCPVNVSEDCLTMNIWTPRLSEITEPLPVMVFIPGGRFEQGASGTVLYESEFLVNTSKVISVSINYRLGALGFAISGTTGSYDANLGIQDQRLALQFVQDNIAAFGGDPTRVTLFGQSAGATSTGIHLTNQESWNYFSQVIIESLPLGLVLPPLELSLSLSRRFSEDLGCGKDLSQLQSCIQTKNLIEILTAQKTAQDKISAISPLFIFMPWQPAVDGVVVTDDILGSVYKGNFKQVPAMWGTVEQEGIMFVVEIWPNGLSAVEYEAIVRDIFRQNDAYKGVLELYPPSHAPGNGTLTSMANLATDYLFSCADLNMTQTMNQILGSNAPNYYFYRYDHVMSFYEAWGPNYTFCYDAVCHGAELPFVFHSATQAGYNWTDNELNLANQMSYYWGNFANTGNPNQGPTPVDVQWPEYDDSTMQNIVLAVPITTQTQEYSNFCTFWDTVGYQLP